MVDDKGKERRSKLISSGDGPVCFSACDYRSSMMDADDSSSLESLFIPSFAAMEPCSDLFLGPPA
jgi:hypothetical protein